MGGGGEVTVGIWNGGWLVSMEGEELYVNYHKSSIFFSSKEGVAVAAFIAGSTVVYHMRWRRELLVLASIVITIMRCMGGGDGDGACVLGNALGDKVYAISTPGGNAEEVMREVMRE